MSNMHCLQGRWSLPCAPVNFGKASAANYSPFWPLRIQNELN